MGVVRSTFTAGQVIENRAWTERLHSLRIALQQMPFKAGQFVRLQREIDGEAVAKSYSLINAPGEPHLEVFFNRVPNGRLSNLLADLQPGDRVNVSQPAAGFFVLDEIPECKQLWMFATGTGLGPYLSMLKTPEVWTRFEQVILVHGVPRIEELVYRELIAQWQASHPGQFRFVSCVSRETNPLGLEGRITDTLRSGILEKHVGLAIAPESSHVMLCGNHHMIDEMKALLGERGLCRHRRHQPGHITTEQYY